MTHTIDVLTEKEKETLRLIVRGHDAKSMAAHLGLSVHTINERLRLARRKLSVTSSKEAARLLMHHEASTPQSLVYDRIGDAFSPPAADTLSISQLARSRAIWIGGIFIMFALTLAAAFVLSGELTSERPVGDPATAFETVQIEDFEVTARNWLAIVDTFDWDESFAAAGRSFRDPNTVSTWRDASEQARVPLGDMIARTPQTVELIQTGGGEGAARDEVVVRFETHFANRRNAIETVTLQQEYGDWKVVGYLID